MPTNLKPKLSHALRLKCPYCGKTSLLKPGNPLEFGAGCEICDYKYEREIGYFSGASWMITYTVAALSAMVAGAIMVWKFSDKGDLIVAGVPAAFGGIAAVLFIPFGRALWMYSDHLVHPLHDADKLSTDAKKQNSSNQ